MIDVSCCDTSAFHTPTRVIQRLVAGTGHVLTGPDHLAALALLSVGTTFRAFALGVRWHAP